jgi:hypothetical protein
MVTLILDSFKASGVDALGLIAVTVGGGGGV